MGTKKKPATRVITVTFNKVLFNLEVSSNIQILGNLLIDLYNSIDNIAKDLINALPGNRCVNTVQHAATGEAVFSVDPTDAPIGWLDSDHVMCLL
jgi:hypothetical protein